MRKTISKLVLLGVILITVLNGYPVTASENNFIINGQEVLDLEERLSENTVVTTDIKEVDEFLSNDDITEVIYIDPYLAEDGYLLEEDSPITPNAIINRYRVRGVKKISDKTDSGAIAVASGQPGMTLGINQTKLVSTTTSAKFGTSDKVISAEVGWSTTGSTAISISGSYKVPSKANGEKVKSCKLSAHAIRKRKSFIVDKMAWNSTKWVKQGTGNVGKAYGVSFKKTFTYK